MHMLPQAKATTAAGASEGPDEAKAAVPLARSVPLLLHLLGVLAEASRARVRASSGGATEEGDAGSGAAAAAAVAASPRFVAALRRLQKSSAEELGGLPWLLLPVAGELKAEEVKSMLPSLVFSMPRRIAWAAFRSILTTTRAPPMNAAMLMYRVLMMAPADVSSDPKSKKVIKVMEAFYNDTDVFHQDVS